MASGKPPAGWYADWLGALEAIHRVVDPDLCAVLRRTDRLADDLQKMEVTPLSLRATLAYVEVLQHDALARAGAAYVLTGAHLMGGEIMRRRLDGFPTRHLEWDDRQTALSELKKLRETKDVAEPARACFQALLNIMDEVLELRPQGV